MTESFAELFEQSLLTQQMRPGSILKATVVHIGPDYILVNAGLKSEGNIPREQFLNESGDLEVAVGDQVDVALEAGINKEAPVEPKSVDDATCKAVAF